MTYIDRAGLEKRFGADEIRMLVSDGDDAMAEPDEDAAAAAAAATIAAAADDAGAEIDGQLSIAYKLPLPAGTYPLLVSIAADLARLRLYDDVAPDHVLARAKRARALLKAIVDDTAALVNSAGTAVPSRGDARTVTRERQFGGSDAGATRLGGLDGF